MAYAQARDVNVSEIPVIDASGLRGGGHDGTRQVADDLRRAAETVGFFYIRNHGVPDRLSDQMFEMSRRFFAHPFEDKMRVAVNAWHRGFIRVGEAKMYDTAQPDLKESYVWGRDAAQDDPDRLAGNPMIGPNNWPGFMPELRPLLTEYMAECNALGHRLFRAFALSLDVDPDTFVRRFERPMSRASIIYYPAQAEAMGEEQFGVAPHTDYGCLTLLYQDATGGLQVRGAGGEWLTAHPIPGTFVVNVGDLLTRWTNDRFASTAHRVVNSSGRERLSFAVFVDPDHDTVIEPVVKPGETARYDPVRCDDYIRGRIDASFAYRKDQG